MADNNSTLGLALAFILFNVLVGLMITAFASEGEQIGTGGRAVIDVEGDVSVDDDVSVSQSRSWFSSFSTTLSGLPSWIKYLYGTISGAWLILIILGYIRGL